MFKGVWIAMLVFASVCLIAAIVLIIIWNIPNLLDELSGRKAKRYIKNLHELNSTTRTFDKMSTNDIYMGISSDLLLSEDFNTSDRELIIESNTVNFEEGLYLQEKENFISAEEDLATSFLSDTGSDIEDSTSFLGDDTEEKTSFLEDGELEDSTSFLSSNSKESKVVYTIKILEEQSSL